MARLGLNLSPQMAQHLKPQQILISSLLQLPLLQLEQKIKEALEENPVLEESEEMEDLDADHKDEIDENEKETAEINAEIDEIEDNSKSEQDKLNEEIQEDINVDEILPNDEDDLPEPKMPRDNSKEEYTFQERYIESMSEHLIQQLQMLNMDELGFDIGSYIIHNLGEDGYLDREVSVDSIAQVFETEPAIIEAILGQVQRLDPVGIAARSVQECLLVQMEARKGNGVRELALIILRDHFEDFANRRFEKLRDGLDVEIDEIKDVIAEIETLNPKPGEGYSDARQNYVLPDFIVEKVDDELIVSLVDYRVPGLRISKQYRKMLEKNSNVKKEAKQFIREKVASAKFFIKAIQQRQNTMQRTMEAIVDKQYDFFDIGPEQITPMIMKDIAEVIEMDISTVSRVCKDKYVQTEYGVFPLKHFFTEGMETEEGESMSTLRIKEQLRDIIEGENKRKPFSDEKLAAMLNDEGIPIARRTVAKYREGLDIPVARLRREI